MRNLIIFIPKEKLKNQINWNIFEENGGTQRTIKITKPIELE